MSYPELDTPSKKAIFVQRVMFAAIKDVGLTRADVQVIRDGITVPAGVPPLAVRTHGQRALHDEIKVLVRWLEMCFDLAERAETRGEEVT